MTELHFQMRVGFALPLPGFRWLALWRRNFLVWKKLLAASVLSNLVDPMIMIFGLAYGLGSMLPAMEGMSYLAFLTAGSICSATMMTASFESMFSAFSRMEGQKTWDGVMYTPLSIDDVITGEWLWAATKAWLTGTTILVLMTALGYVASIGHALAASVVYLLIGLVFSAMGLVMTTLARNWDFFSYYMTLFLAPMTMISGVFFPIEQMPAVVQTIAGILPLHHAVSLLRPLLAGHWPGDAWQHIAVLVSVATVAYGLAVGTARKRFAC